MSSRKQLLLTMALLVRGPRVQRPVANCLVFVVLAWGFVLPALADESGPSKAATPAASARLPVPGQARQQDVLSQLKDIYDFSKTRTPDAKRKLARELFAIADKSGTDSAERFVLLRQVMELARDGGDLPLALQAAAAISSQFEVDPLLGKVKVLTDFAHASSSAAAVGTLVEEALDVAEQARDSERYEVAVNLIEAVSQACRNRPVPAAARKRVNDLRSDLRKTQLAWEKFQTALQTLQAQPDDAAANLVAGRWACLQRAEWETGLRQLAKSSDANLQRVAAQDLAAPQEAAAQVAVADAWCDLSKATDDNAGFRDRAIHWYAAARDQASGLLSVKIGKRLKELGAAEEEQRLATPSPPKADVPKPNAPKPDVPVAKAAVPDSMKPPASAPSLAGRDLPAPLVGPTPGNSRPGSTAMAPSSAAMTLTVTLSATVTGVTSEILGLAFSPDGKALAATGFDNDIRVLEVASWRTQTVLRGHTDEARWLAYSPAGRLLASGSKDRQIKLWNIAAGRCEQTLAGHAGPVFSQMFSPDGRLLASAGQDATIRLWDLPGGQPRATLTGHPSWIWSVAFSPDGGRLASGGGNDNTLRIWDVASGKCLAVCEGHQAKVRGAAFLPDGKTVASTAEDNTLRLWDGQTGRPLRTLHADGPLHALGVAPRGEFLAAAGPTFIRFWESATGRELFTVRDPVPQATWVLAFSSDQRWLASGGSGKTLQLWSVRLQPRLPAPSGP